MDKEFFWITLEDQLREDDSRGAYWDHFTNKDDALAKLYAVLAEAVKSTCKYHACFLIRSDGVIEGESKVFDRRV